MIFGLKNKKHKIQSKESQEIKAKKLALNYLFLIINLIKSSKQEKEIAILLKKIYKIKKLFKK